MARPFLSVVIPTFNEQVRIISTLEKVVEYLSAQQYTWEVLVVDDGSSDDTAALVRQWTPKNAGVRLKTIAHGGKGCAVKHGMLAATGEYRFMCDADLAMPIEHLEAFINRMAEGYDIVIGSRQIAGARRFDESASRHIMGRMFNWSVKLLAVGGFQDTQCGFKCFRGEAADELFQLQRTRGWGFDVEILYLALKRRMRVLEMPIDWYHQKDSKVRPGVDSFLMMRDTILVRWRALLGRYRADSVVKSVATCATAESEHKPD
ncbi:MAG: glycosyltransferase family 2 protein [Chloroflexi bacterium]|nr:glycosyltransferase family 2 protein [Chloroflexota bacterium]